MIAYRRQQGHVCFSQSLVRARLFTSAVQIVERRKLCSVIIFFFTKQPLLKT